MRPLPQLADLQPSQPVFDPSADDLEKLLSGDLSNFDTLQSLLDSQTDPAVAATGDMQTTLDSIGSIFDGIDGTFAHLDNSLAQLSYEQEIADVAALEKSFADSVSSWAPDLGGAIAGLGAIFDAFYNDVLVPIFYYLGALIDALFTLIDQLFQMIVGILAAIA